MNVGDHVVVTDPDGFIAEVRNKVKDGRVGEVTRVRDDASAVVVFPAVGRRKEFKNAFRFIFLTKVEPEVTPTVSSPSRPKM